ncbi:MAG: LysE family transporter [Actinomycetales bacterium]|nr:LysE family transporter [Actinomycetales bacterium]
MEEILLAAGAGIAAGLGVAMPLGAIGALLLREGLVNGFRVAAAAATGIAVVDTVYCLIAALTGALFAPLVQEHQGAFLAVSGVLIVLFGAHQLVTTIRRRTSEDPSVERIRPLAAFGKFVGLTAVNPMTLVYFIALAGAITTRASSPLAPAVFVGAVGLSSWAWQLGLAAAGTMVGRSLSHRAAKIIGVAASVVIMTLGVVVLASGLLS